MEKKIDNVDEMVNKVIELAKAEASILVPDELPQTVDIFDEESAEIQTKKLFELFNKNKKSESDTAIPNSVDNIEQKAA